MTSERTAAQRLVTPDVLRGVAIVAMLLAHAQFFLPEAPGAVRFVVGNISNMASPLFALVMGVSAQLIWKQAAGRSPWVTIGQQCIRGLVLIILGLWMETWGSWVAVVLCYLGLLLIVGAPLVLLRTPALAAVAVAVALASGPINAWARDQILWTVQQPWIVQQLAAWVAQGYAYRLTNLLPFFLLGALLMRAGLRRDRWMWTMLAVAPFAYLARPIVERLTGWNSVSGDYLDTLHDIGLVFLTYAVVIFLVTVRAEGPARVIDAIGVPIRACGQVALSLYLLHVAFIGWWNTTFGFPTEDHWIGWIITVPVVIAIGWAWWRFVGTGPVEWMLGFVSFRPKPLYRPARPAVQGIPAQPAR